MELIELPELTEEHKAQLEGDEEDPFDGARADLTFEKKERRVGFLDGDRLVAAAGWLHVEVEVAGARFPVLGIGGVIVNADYRGRGLARQAVEAALERGATDGLGLAMLFCLDDRAGLYRKLGFEEIEAPVTVDQPNGQTEMPLVAMWKALTPGAPWPDGPVRLLGLPF
jgi:GNAT superfamily N-acetyltransferase